MSDERMSEDEKRELDRIIEYYDHLLLEMLEGACVRVN
jgi:hypothetical protein